MQQTVRGRVSAVEKKALRAKVYDNAPGGANGSVAPRAGHGGAPTLLQVAPLPLPLPLQQQQQLTPAQSGHVQRIRSASKERYEGQLLPTKKLDLIIILAYRDGNEF